MSGKVTIDGLETYETCFSCIPIGARFKLNDGRILTKFSTDRGQYPHGDLTARIFGRWTVLCMKPLTDLQQIGVPSFNNLMVGDVFQFIGGTYFYRRLHVGCQHISPLSGLPVEGQVFNPPNPDGKTRLYHRPPMVAQSIPPEVKLEEIRYVDLDVGETFSFIATLDYVYVKEAGGYHGVGGFELLAHPANPAAKVIRVLNPLKPIVSPVAAAADVRILGRAPEYWKIEISGAGCSITDKTGLVRHFCNTAQDALPAFARSLERNDTYRKALEEIVDATHETGMFTGRAHEIAKKALADTGFGPLTSMEKLMTGSTKRTANNIALGDTWTEA
jgi:hypothetical protein